ncbi:hypothetical protein [Hymenobacter arizonensis]|uniref:hypothetical protein n=1 Tax=Hymenobacter arizonensis TaxID=1227077 RepID=UPI0011603920|nr:hypothetical protein [Hymenobacter arizonensis]
MLRSFILFVSLLGFFATAEAVAAPTSATKSPYDKILPGDHRPNYKRYGHHGLFERGGLFSFRSSRGFGKPSGTRSTSKRRGTL